MWSVEKQNVLADVLHCVLRVPCVKQDCFSGFNQSYNCLVVLSLALLTSLVKLPVNIATFSYSVRPNLNCILLSILHFLFRQRKGEFLPDKIYNNCHDKENGDASMEDVQTLPSIIDPSTPRITDVPHKPTRNQATGGGAGRGSKKAKKPMGVQVTYKPPEWD